MKYHNSSRKFQHAIEDIFLEKLGGNTSNTHLIVLDILTEIKNKHN